MQVTMTDCTGIDTEIESLLEEIDVVTELTKRCIAENSQTAQNQEEYAARYNGFVERYEKAKARLEQLRTTKAVREAQAEAIGTFMFEMQELDTITEFDEKLWLTTVDTVTVHADGRMTFKLQGGKTLTSLVWNRFLARLHPRTPAPYTRIFIACLQIRSSRSAFSSRCPRPWRETGKNR